MFFFSVVVGEDRPTYSSVGELKALQHENVRSLEMLRTLCKRSVHDKSRVQRQQG